MNGNASAPSDLGRIRGIGRTGQRWLNRKFGIKTLQQLAGLSASSIEPQLERDERSPPRVELERWIAEASALVRDSAPARRAAVGGEPRAVSPAVRHADAAEPTSVASFVVEFGAIAGGRRQGLQTKVHHLEGDCGAAWQGFDAPRAALWIERRMLDLGLAPDPSSASAGGPARPRAADKPAAAPHEADRVAAAPAARAESAPAARAATRPASGSQPLAAGQPVDPQVLWAYQPQDMHEPLAAVAAGQPFPVALRADEAFALGIGFTLPAPESPFAAPDRGQPAVTFGVRELESGTERVLGTTEARRLAGDSPRLVARLPVLRLERGTYRLFAMIRSRSFFGAHAVIDSPQLMIT